MAHSLATLVPPAQNYRPMHSRSRLHLVRAEAPAVVAGGDGVVLSPAALTYVSPRARSLSGPTLMSPRQLPTTFGGTSTRRAAAYEGSRLTAASSAAGAATNKNDSVMGRVKEFVKKMWSSVGKAISEFSKAASCMRGAKGEVLRGIIGALRGAGGMLNFLSAGDFKGLASAAKSFGSILKSVAKRVPRMTSSWGFLLKRGGAFIPILGTALEGYGAYQAIQKANEAAKKGNKTGAAIWSGAAALHTLAATLSGCVDLVLTLTAGAAAPVYGAVNGVVAGLGAVADIAGELTS